METLKDAIDLFEAAVLPHWPFIMWALVSMMIGQTMNKSVFTMANARAKSPQWLWWWGRKTLPLHPIAAGFMLGLVWKEPEAGVVGIGSCMYFAGAGACSIVLYEILKNLAKKRGIELELPGQSEPPTPPKP